MALFRKLRRIDGTKGVSTFVVLSCRGRSYNQINRGSITIKAEKN